MELSQSDCEKALQWFEICHVRSPAHFASADYLFAKKLYDAIGRDAPSEIQQRCEAVFAS